MDKNSSESSADKTKEELLKELHGSGSESDEESPDEKDQKKESIMNDIYAGISDEDE